MAATLVTSMSLKPSPFIERSAKKNLPSLSRPPLSLEVQAGSRKKIKTATPYGPGGGLILKDGLDASGRKAKGKGVYQFVDKYGANVDGHSPIYTPEEWSPSGEVYVGGNTGLLIWAVTLGGLLLGGALLVYNTSALAQ